LSGAPEIVPPLLKVNPSGKAPPMYNMPVYPGALARQHCPSPLRRQLHHKTLAPATETDYH